MQLEILSPEKTLFTGEVDSVIFPGSQGKFQILNNHAPIISSLSQGNIDYKINSKNNQVEIKRGIVEVLKNKISALIEQ
jgi:F-type H+-transporting ATPase subunit epsilon|tara:strand:+ start:203 stop:439 length:237 start_codon:yes stop_codon:yes gene_type:complete